MTKPTTSPSNCSSPTGRRRGATATAIWFCVALGLLRASTVGAAEGSPDKTPSRLAGLSLEQLLNEPVTSVSKKETKLGDSPAAISVITAEDTKDLELNSVVYYVDQTTHSPFQGQVTTPAYVRLDLGVTWRPTKNLELSVWGQNLLDDRHSEFTSFQTSFVTEIPRSVFGKITWRF